MRYLVTGGAGFVGSNLVDRLLAEDHEVDVIDDLSRGKLTNLAEARARAQGALKIHHLDIRSRDTVTLMERRAPEIVVHLAAQIDVRVSVNDPVFDAEVNIIGLLNVLEGARAADSSKVVFASSGGTIYGDVPDDSLPIRENQPQRPLSPYGIAKKASTDYLHAYRDLYELDFTSLAFANIYGPRQDPHGEAGVVAIFTQLLLDGRQCTIFGDGSQTRDYVFIDDVVDSIVRATARGGGLLCNIGTGVETTVVEVHDSVARALGVKAQPIFAAERPGELRRNALDPGRAQMQLGWRPFTAFDDGVAQTVDWFHQQREAT
ncbi:MAG: UDP-glucose 4-epimerase [Actinomycetota bacterium]|jgi:UDP-glucose 4-epimerase